MSHLRYACLAMFYVTCAFVTYRNERLPWTGRLDWPATELLIRFACGLLLLAACVTDAKVRRHPLTGGATLTAFMTLPVSVPVYLVWSRGWRGMLWLVVNLLIFVLVAFTAAAIANAVTRSQLVAVNADAIQQSLEEK